jgi:polysaccharide export outer membrane protein
MFLLLVLASLLGGRAAAQQPPPVQPPKSVLPGANNPAIINTGAVGDDAAYRVGPGDLIDVRVFGRPELGRETRINNQGQVRLPFIGDVRVACMDENRLAQLLTDKYKKYLRDPQVDVFVKEYKSQPVAVIGSVATPGRFQLQRRVRLLELLTFAGGTNLNSGGVVHVIRGTGPDLCEMDDPNAAINAKAPAAGVIYAEAAPPAVATSATPTSGAVEGTATPGAPKSDQAALQSAAQTAVEQGQAVLLTFNLKELLTGAPESNPYVKPGDIISVPETDMVYVIGNVIKPGPLSMRSKITLLQAIGMAGGFMPDAAKGRVKIVRQDPGSNNRREILFNIDDIQRKKAEDVALQPNDVVEVPMSIAKNTARSLLSVGVGMVGAVPFWVFR